MQGAMKCSSQYMTWILHAWTHSSYAYLHKIKLGKNSSTDSGRAPESPPLMDKLLTVDDYSRKESHFPLRVCTSKLPMANRWPLIHAHVGSNNWSVCISKAKRHEIGNEIVEENLVEAGRGNIENIGYIWSRHILYMCIWNLQRLKYF